MMLELDANMLEKIEAGGFDWLIRSNKTKTQGRQELYFCNITAGSPPDPGFRSWPAYGDDPQDALSGAYYLWKRR